MKVTRTAQSRKGKDTATMPTVRVPSPASGVKARFAHLILALPHQNILYLKRLKVIDYCVQEIMQLSLLASPSRQ